ncbi:hypothetical protein Tco_0594721 [Tanacetum coccineum]
MRIEESLNVRFDECPPLKSSPLVDDDIIESQIIDKQIKEIEDKENGPLNEEIVNIKETKDHPLGKGKGYTKTDVSLQYYSKLPDATSDSPRTRVEILGIQSILSVYQDVFADVNTLSPNRSHTHYITLLPNSTPPNIRPYRYPYDQKIDIEAQVNELLTCGFVRPSSSPFVGLVLLVKKKDES